MFSPSEVEREEENDVLFVCVVRLFRYDAVVGNFVSCSNIVTWKSSFLAADWLSFRVAASTGGGSVVQLFHTASV
jgi:hypothetical protein